MADPHAEIAARSLLQSSTMKTSASETRETERDRVARELDDLVQRLMACRPCGVSLSLMQELEVVRADLATVAAQDPKLAAEVEGLREELEEILYSREAADDVILRGQRIAALLKSA